MKTVLLILLYILFSHNSVGQSKPPLSTEKIICEWDTSYSIFIKHYIENDYLELVISGDTISLPDTIPIGKKIDQVNFIKLRQINNLCFEVFASKDNSFQYYLFEINKPDIGVAGRQLFCIDRYNPILSIKEIEYFQNLYTDNNLLIKYTDNNNDGFEDIGFMNKLTSNVTWIYWNDKKGFRKK